MLRLDSLFAARRSGSRVSVSRLDYRVVFGSAVVRAGDHWRVPGANAFPEYAETTLYGSRRSRVRAEYTILNYSIPFNRPCLVGNEYRYIAEAIAKGHASGDGSFTRRSVQFG